MSTISSEKSQTKEVAHINDLSRDQNPAPSSHGSLEFEQLHAEGDGEEPVYATGLRLVMIMTTINLSSLIASLDLVSDDSGAIKGPGRAYTSPLTRPILSL